MLQSLVHNSIQIREKDGVIVPLRFSEPQMAFFDPLIYRFRSYDAAGICLDFITDSPFVHMAYEVEIKPNTTELLYFDVLVDHQLTASPGQVFTTLGSGEWQAVLPIKRGEPKRVTIYLPYLAQIRIRGLNVEDGALLQPLEAAQRPKGNLLCLGDSITQGMNAVHPSSTYAVLLSRFLDMNLINQAVSGYVYNADALDSNLPYQPDLITVAYGTNDWSICESYEQFEEQSSAYLQKLADIYPDVPIKVLSPIWRSDIAETTAVGEFVVIYETLRRISSKFDRTQLIDGLTLTPHHPHYFADGLHPTDEGFLHMAFNIVKQLRN